MRVTPGLVLVDTGFAVLSDAGPTETAAVKGGRLSTGAADVRGIWVVGADGWRYTVLANFGATERAIEVNGEARMLAAGECTVTKETHAAI